MIVEPKVKGFICTTAHPVGCRENIKRQIEYVKALGENHCPRKVLVIGASTGYGLASRIAAAFGGHADTLGVMFEKEASGKRTATPGYYNTKAFEEFAEKEGLYAHSINGDAFSKEIKDQVIETIRNDLGTVDLVVYSLAAPRRTMADGTVYQSVLKTTGEIYKQKSLNLRDNTITEAVIEPATPEEIFATEKVMGGEDWYDWIQALTDAGVVAENAVTLAYSYIGPEVTHPIYKEGSIGQAKKHLYQTSVKMNEDFASLGLKAYISVNKALVTQSSAAIPIVPLYISLLYRVMKDAGLQEGCIEQMDRLFMEKLPNGPETDEEGRIRLDDYEMRPEVQDKISEVWDKVDSESIETLGDIKEYWDEFYHMFGFGYENVDYSEDVEI